MSDISGILTDFHMNSFILLTTSSFSTSSLETADFSTSIIGYTSESFSGSIPLDKVIKKSSLKQSEYRRILKVSREIVSEEKISQFKEKLEHAIKELTEAEVESILQLDEGTVKQQKTQIKKRENRLRLCLILYENSLTELENLMALHKSYIKVVCR